jgi:hypothetical protein
MVVGKVILLVHGIFHTHGICKFKHLKESNSYTFLFDRLLSLMQELELGGKEYSEDIFPWEV